MAPKRGKVVNLGDHVGYIKGLTLAKGNTQVTALTISLLDENLKIDLVKAASRIFAY